MQDKMLTLRTALQVLRLTPYAKRPELIRQLPRPDFNTSLPLADPVT